jgi:hypothetical protein
MTYVPVDPETHKGTGRTPMEIPEALLAQLRHSRATGAKCVIPVGPDDDPADIAELKRALVRAGYRHFSENTIYKTFRPHEITYWVGPKKAKGRKNGDDQ